MGCHLHDGEGGGRFPPTVKHSLAGHGFDSAQGSGERRKLSWIGCFIRCCCRCPGVRHHGQTAPVGPQWHRRDWGLLPEAPLCCCMQPRRLSAPPAAESPAHSGLQAYGEGERGGERKNNECITLGQDPRSSPSSHNAIFLSSLAQGQHLSCVHTTLVVQAPDM